MQKVRSDYLFKFLLELLIKPLFDYYSLTVLFSIAYISYLALEEGSPLLIQTGFNPFYLLFFLIIKLLFT